MNMYDFSFVAFALYPHNFFNLSPAALLLSSDIVKNGKKKQEK